MKWNARRIAREVRYGLTEMQRAIGPVERVRGFASPGWSGPSALWPVLVANGFDYVADTWGRHREADFAPSNRTLLRVPTHLVGEPGGVAYLEHHTAVGSNDRDVLSEFESVHAVQVAVQETLRALGPLHRLAKVAEPRPPLGKLPGDRRIGVVWHTQGSGKSLTMAFYAGRIAREPMMENPTIVVLTDRNDLDDQLFGTFSRCRDLLWQTPVQARNRADLRSKLAVEQGGVVFTTIQKFLPEEKGDRRPTLSPRRNIVVIADEVHRSQYDFIDGYARHMRDALPNASFIGFTGTPIELEDANTRAVFGDYISVYDIERAVEDRATVPIYYESRLAKLALDEAERPTIDPDFEEATEGERRSNARRSSRPSGLNLRPSPDLRTASSSSPRTSYRTSTTAPRPWTARR